MSHVLSDRRIYHQQGSFLVRNSDPILGLLDTLEFLRQLSAPNLRKKILTATTMATQLTALKRNQTKLGFGLTDPSTTNTSTPTEEPQIDRSDSYRRLALGFYAP